VRLRVTREEAQAQAADVPAETLLLREGGSELRIPVLEERLIPGTQAVDEGELRIHTRVEEREERVRQPVTRDDLELRQVPINRPIDAPVQRRTEGEWLIIPIMEEVLVVTKQLMLKEEIHIRTQQVTEEQEVIETTRHERVDLDDATERGVRGLRQPKQPNRD